MDYRNITESFREVGLDIKEGSRHGYCKTRNDLFGYNK